MEMIDVAKTLPTPQDLHVNAALTNVAIAWQQEASRFAAMRVFPAVPVEKQSDAYFVWDEGDFFRDEAEEKSSNSHPPLMNLRLANDTYFAKVFHIGGIASEMDITNQDPAVNKEEAITRAIVNKLLIKCETQWTSKFFTTGVWTGSTTGTDIVPGVLWDNYGASNPVTDIRTQVQHLCRLGINPMDLKLTMGVQVFNTLLDHPKFLERYEQVQASILNEQLMAAVLGIGEVVVPYSSRNTAAEGAAASISYIHGKNALLTYSPKAAARDMPSAGYTFVWSGLVGAGGNGLRIRRWWDNDLSGWKIVGDNSYDHKKTSAICGVFFSNVIT